MPSSFLLEFLLVLLTFSSYFFEAIPQRGYSTLIKGAYHVYLNGCIMSCLS